MNTIADEWTNNYEFGYRSGFLQGLRAASVTIQKEVLMARKTGLDARTLGTIARMVDEITVEHLLNSGGHTVAPATFNYPKDAPTVYRNGLRFGLSMVRSRIENNLRGSFYESPGKAFREVLNVIKELETEFPHPEDGNG